MNYLHAVSHRRLSTATTRILSLILLTIGIAAIPAAAHAQSCQSATQVATDLWSEYGKAARQAGCVGVTGGSVIASGGASLPQTVSQYKACMGKADKDA